MQGPPDKAQLISHYRLAEQLAGSKAWRKREKGPEGMEEELKPCQLESNRVR